MDTRGHELKVVFQLSSDDTQVHKSLISQMNNLMKAIPGIRIEIVTHGPGIQLLMRESVVKNSVEKLHGKGVAFLVCQNTLHQKGIDRAEVLEMIEVIPAAIAHIVVRQSQGWSYVKAGF